MIVQTEIPRSDDPYRILPVAHNWATAYRHSIEFKTDISRSVNGKEQRRAVRDEPRLSSEMTGILHASSRHNFDMLMTAWHPKKVMVGMDHLSVRTRGVLAAEADSVTIQPQPEVPWWFKADQIVILEHFDQPGVRETRTISSWSAGSLTFADTNDVSAVPARSRVLPAWPALVDPEQATTRLTNIAGTTAIKTNFDPETDMLPIVGAPVFEGLWEVFQWKPNWGGNAGMTHQWPYNIIDYEYGRRAVWDEIEFPTRVYQHTYVGRSNKQTYEIMNFFHRHKGMWKEFLLPTWDDDIQFTALTGGGQSILVAGEAFGTVYRDSTVFKRIMLRYPDGTVSYHKVDYIESLPGTNSSVLRVTEPLPVASLTASTVLGISWLLVCRFAIDRMDVDFLTNGVAQFTLNMQTVENFEL